MPQGRGSTWELPRQQWGGYLRRVARAQRDRPVRVELVGPELGDQVLVQHARLRGISLNAKGSLAGSIELELNSEDEQVDHRVLQPVKLYADLAPGGELVCLDIEEQDHTKTLLRFEQLAQLPE